MFSLNCITKHTLLVHNKNKPWVKLLAKSLKLVLSNVCIIVVEIVISSDKLKVGVVVGEIVAMVWSERSPSYPGQFNEMIACKHKKKTRKTSNKNIVRKLSIYKWNKLEN